MRKQKQELTILREITRSDTATVYSIRIGDSSDSLVLKQYKKVKHFQAEKRALESLNRAFPGAMGIPQLRQEVQCPDGSQALILDNLGITLKQYVSLYGSSKDDLIRIAVILINVLRMVRMCGLIHGNVKPDNIMMDTHNKPAKAYLIDYAFSYPYLDERRDHIPRKHATSFVGSPKYCS